MLETAPDPIVEVDPDGTHRLANARTDKLFGYDREQILGPPGRGALRRAHPHAGRRALPPPCCRRTASDSQVALGMGLELWGQRKDGTEFPVDVTLSPLHTDDGVVVTSIIRDITERKRFENQLQHLADHDALTELFNRRRFDQELAEYVAYAARYGGEGSVFLLDLDRFKYVNDTRGHKAGDEVIRAVGRALHDSVRKTRRGGPPRRRRVRRPAARRRPRHRGAHRRGHARDDPRAAPAARGPAHLDDDLDRHRLLRATRSRASRT